MSGLARFKDLCMDTADHQAQADWWCAVLGYVRRAVAAGAEPRPVADPVPIVDPEGRGPIIWVIAVPEAKTVKNRMHIDVVGPVADLLAVGATLVLAKGDDREWDVLADPEGNEFCVFEP